MATQQIVNSNQSDVESLVNRWVVDYYLSLALELFEKRQYADFCDIRDVLAQVLLRPFEATDVMQTKIRVLEFLSRIYEGESLESSFESDHSVSPLESALVVLESINQQCSIPQQDFKNVCTSLTEMMVAILIKNNEFDRAKILLRKHFPKPNVGKKAIFMDLISQRTKRHQVIEQIDFQQFKEDMLAFCQRLCPFTVPFLHKAAKRLIESFPEGDDKAGGPDEQNNPDLSTASQIHIIHCVPRISIIQRTRLEAVFKALAAGSVVRTFVELEDEVEKDLSLHHSAAPLNGADRDSEQNGLFQRGSGSPMEASPADQPPQTDAVPETQAESRSNVPAEPGKRPLYSMARLVVELDSQESSQCTTAPQAEPDVRTENPPESPADHNKRRLQNPVTDIKVATPIRKLPRRTSTYRSSRASTSRGETSADSEEDPPAPVAEAETSVEKQHNTSLGLDSPKSKQLSVDSEEDLQEVPVPCRTPVKKPSKQLARSSSSSPGHVSDDCVIDSSVDSSPNLFSPKRAPGTSSTPQEGSAQGKGPSHSKWKDMFNNAKEGKDTWSDEESYFPSKKSKGSHESTLSNSGHKKMKWTESETQRLKEGVKKFGEGNWSKIKAYYSFDGRTNINLKDRWRTMKKLKMV